MDDLKILYYEVLAAMQRCREESYSTASIDNALRCVASYYKALPSGSQKKAVGELLLSLDKKKTIARESGTILGEGTMPPVQRSDLDALCPITPCASIPRPELSVSYVIDTAVGRMYRDNALIVCGPFADELVYEAKNFAVSQKADFRFVDIEPFVTSGSFGKVLQLLLRYYAANGAADVIAYKGLESLAGHPADAKNFSLVLRQMRLKAKRCTQLLLSTDPAYYFNDVYTSAFGSSAGGGNILEDDFSIKALSFIYLPLPTCADVTRTVLQRLHLGELPARRTGSGPDATSFTDGQTDGDGSGTDGFSGADTGAGTNMPGTGSDTDNSPAAEAAAYIKATCAPMACGCLMDILLQSADFEAFKSRVDLKVAVRRKTLNEFLDKAGSSAASAILDTEWEFKRSSKKKTVQGTLHPLPTVKYTIPVTQYDYDCMDDISSIRSSIQSVLDAEEDYEGNPITVKQKCGLVLRYALLNEDAMNLVNVTQGQEDIMSARWTLGYAALTQLMRVPCGNLSIDIGEKDTMMGQCCDGGQTVRFNKKFIKDTSCAADGCDTMLHELFHALQAEALKAFRKVENRKGVNCEAELDLIDYYRQNFGVTEFRIREAWEDNQTRGYVQNTTDYNAYHIQVYEADARVFAAEAWSDSEGIQLRKVN